MKKKKYNLNQKSQHSFYKEAKNSFFGEKQLSSDMVIKKIKKVLKCSLYGYLVVATLWGCVNQFRNPTSQNVTQGIEFYRTDDDVWSNLYQSQTSTTYSVVNEGVSYHTDFNRINREGEKFTYKDNHDIKSWNKEFTGSTEASLGEGTVGYTQVLQKLEFYTMNPNFYFDSQEDSKEIKKYSAAEWVNTQDLEIRVADLQTKSGNANSRTYGYQASDSDINGFVPHVMLVDWDKADKEFFGDNFVTQSTVVPIGLQIINKIGKEDKNLANSWTKFMGAADIWQDEKDIFKKDDDGKILEDSNGYKVFDQDNWYVLLNSETISRDSNPDNINFESEEFVMKFLPKLNLNKTIKDDNKYIQEQLKFMLNMYAFNYPELNVDELTFLKIKGEEELVTAEILYEELTGEKEFKYSAKLPSAFLIENYSGEGYNDPLVDFNPKTTPELKFGNQLFIYEQKKGEPIKPTTETLNIMENERKKAVLDITNNETDSWQYLETNRGSGHDHRTNNMGWGIVDGKGELRKVTSSFGEESYLWGLTRATDYGHITNKMLIENPKYSKYVLTEQNYNYQFLADKDKPYTMESQFGAYVGKGNKKETLEFETNNEYLGLQGANEMGYHTKKKNYPRGPSQRGVLRPIYWDKPTNKDTSEWKVRTWKDEFHSDYWRKSDEPDIINDYKYKWEPTAADYASQAIATSGEDPQNGSRVVFVSWSDWGKAWGPNFGPMHGTFLFPLAMVSLTVESWFPYDGFGAWGVLLGVFIIIFVLRGIGTLLSWKSHDNQQKMQEVQTKVAEIKSKYEKYDKSNKQMKQKQQQEIMSLYKKHDVNPFASFGSLFLTMPIFLSMWTIISSIVTYKIASIGMFSFAATPFFGMFNIGSMFIFYFLVAVGVGLSQGVSSKLPSWLADRRNGVRRLDEATKAARKKQNKMSNIMVGVFVFMGLTIPTLLAFYWMISALFTISLELLRHYLKIRKGEEITMNNTSKKEVTIE